MRNIMVKYSLLLAFFSICLKSFAQGPPPTNSVTITPTSNTTDVKGNIKASGLVEANGLKATGLATGNPYVANPVYANIYGDLVTGYKTGFYSIPPAAFHLNYNVFGNTTFLSEYFILYLENSMASLVSSQYYGFIAPMQIPHKSKLVAMNLNFAFGGTTPKSIRIRIVQTPLSGSGSQIIKDITTPTSVNQQVTTANIPLDLIEIDNENYTYVISLSVISNWDSFVLFGTSIEYRDL
jgi:hypothetical protein